MCGRQFDELEWNKIPGIALGKLASSKFIDRHDLVDSYLEWLNTQDTVKFNGYPYDLLMRLQKASRTTYLSSFAIMGDRIQSVPLVARKTIDLQFDNLIATAQRDGKITENVLCALDTSGSMGSSSFSKIAPIDVCISLGLYFSTLNQGHFHKKVMMFDNTSRMQELHGSFSEMFSQIPQNAMGGTNFMSVIDSLVSYRNAHPEIPIEEYPTTLLVVSDMQFNIARTRHGRSIGTNVETNYEMMKRVLATAFPQDYIDKIKFIWWNVNGEHGNMPATMNDGGCYFFSGFDGAIVSLLLNEETQEKEKRQQKTMDELVHEALSQEVFSLIR